MRSPGEEALGEGGDEGDFDKQAKGGFGSRYRRLGIARLKGRRKEPASVEGGQTDHYRLVPGQAMAAHTPKSKVDGGKAQDYNEVGGEAAKGAVAVPVPGAPNLTEEG